MSSFRLNAALSRPRSRLLGLLPAVVLVLVPTDASAQHVQLELHSTLFTEGPEKEQLAKAFGGAIKGGYRWGNFGLFGQVEQNIFYAGLVNSTEEQTYAVLNVGGGTELLFAGGHARTSFAMGASILDQTTGRDQAGATGIFLDLRPIGLRFKVNEHLWLNVDPLSGALLIPELGGIPLVDLQFRTTIIAEWVP